MSILDTRYKTIYLDFILNKVNDIDLVFSISDLETSDFYVKVTKNNEEIDLSSFKTILWILKDDGTTDTKDLTQDEKELGLFYCNLENRYKNQVGVYKAQVLVKDPNTLEQKMTGKFEYTVTKDIPYLENPSEVVSIDIPIKLYDDETNTEEIVIITNSDIEANLTIEEVEA